MYGEKYILASGVTSVSSMYLVAVLGGPQDDYNSLHFPYWLPRQLLVGVRRLVGGVRKHRLPRSTVSRGCCMYLATSTQTEILTATRSALSGSLHARS